MLARAGRAHAPRPRSGRRAPSPDGQVSAEMVGEGLSWCPFMGYLPVTLGDQRLRDPCAADGRASSQVRPTREWTPQLGSQFGCVRGDSWRVIRKSLFFNFPRRASHRNNDPSKRMW